MAHGWESRGAHLILRPPRWWLYLSLALLAAGVTGGAASALLGMWGRAIAWSLWVPWGFSWFRNMAIIDRTGLRTRGLRWRSYRWGEVRITRARRLPSMRRVSIRTNRGARVFLPGRVTLGDIRQFLPHDAVVTTERAAPR